MTVPVVGVFDRRQLGYRLCDTHKVLVVGSCPWCKPADSSKREGAA